MPSRLSSRLTNVWTWAALPMSRFSSTPGWEIYCKTITLNEMRTSCRKDKYLQPGLPSCLHSYASPCVDVHNGGVTKGLILQIRHRRLMTLPRPDFPIWVTRHCLSQAPRADLRIPKAEISWIHSQTMKNHSQTTWGLKVKWSEVLVCTSWTSGWNFNFRLALPVSEIFGFNVQAASKVRAEH